MSELDTTGYEQLIRDTKEVVESYKAAKTQMDNGREAMQRRLGEIRLAAKKRKGLQQTGSSQQGAPGNASSSSSSSTTPTPGTTSMESRTKEAGGTDEKEDQDGDAQMQDDMGIPLATPNLLMPSKRSAEDETGQEPARGRPRLELPQGDRRQQSEFDVSE